MDKANTMPFSPTQFSRTAENIQAAPASAAPAQGAMQPSVPASVPAHAADMESLYPDIYRDLYPVVMGAVNSMASIGYTPTPDAIGLIVDNIIKNSGLWHEDEDDRRFDMSSEAVPVQFGFDRTPYRRRTRGAHNRDTLRDIVQILLLRELLPIGGGFPLLFY